MWSVDIFDELLNQAKLDAFLRDISTGGQALEAFRVHCSVQTECTPGIRIPDFQICVSVLQDPLQFVYILVMPVLCAHLIDAHGKHD